MKSDHKPYRASTIYNYTVEISTWAFQCPLKKGRKEERPAGTWSAGTKAKELGKTITDQTHSQSGSQLSLTYFVPNVKKESKIYTIIFLTHMPSAVAAANLDCGVPREPEWSHSEKECSKLGHSQKVFAGCSVGEVLYKV